MNAVEIEAAVSELAAAPFDAGGFPFQFLAAFDKKETTLKRLRKRDTNKSDIPGAVLLINNIHLATCPAGQTREMVERLKASVKTASARAKFVFATDGSYFEAEDVTGGQEPVADFLPNLANHFGFFLPLAGISTVREIKDNPIDVRATGRLNKLYVELLRINPEWGTAARRHDMNHFMARLIFCYFAEHTDIFEGRRLFTDTIEQMSLGDGSNTHEVMEQIFRAMDICKEDRAARLERDLPLYAGQFPYVNGGLFRGSAETPRFSRIARSYLLQAGKLEWQHINPDIFGSMIQAVADDEERGALGMHYTSVPNILKVLNPLFLDDLRAQLDAAGDNGRMLLNLRQRMSRIRVFDPACGSGNFLVIAYKQMRSIEAEINRRRLEPIRPTDIPTNNFRGIEIRDFAAEIARLALVIAEYQCDVSHRGPLAAKAEFLPLDEMNWITTGNALRLDWMTVCRPEGSTVKLVSNDLFQTPLEQAEVDFENEGGETYICGNPPYVGSTWQSADQKADSFAVLGKFTKNWKSLDYVASWFFKAAEYGLETRCASAFVSTNSVCQGQQVAILWPGLFSLGYKITFAYSSLKWSNLASHNAGVTVVIVGIDKSPTRVRRLFSITDDGEVMAKETSNINAYLISGDNLVVQKMPTPLNGLPQMMFGNKPVDGGALLLTRTEAKALGLAQPIAERFVHRFYGAEDFINGIQRYCLWVRDEDLETASSISSLSIRFARVRVARLASPKMATVSAAENAHRFAEIRQTGRERVIVIPSVTSENRDYLPVGLLAPGSIISNRNYGIFDADLWNLALIASRLHLVWIGTVCGRLRTDFSYTNTLGWNTFPVPKLTEQNKTDLDRCAKEILLAREAHFPATISELYAVDAMPESLRNAHQDNDEVLERIYIGRSFRNDTERLERLFEMYTKMTMIPSGGEKVMAK